MKGFGVFTWVDGRTYEGEYDNDKKHGHGVYKWQNGRIYDGFWANGVQDGVGKYTNSKGEIKFGKWQNGKVQDWISESQYQEEISKKRNNTR